MFGSYFDCLSVLDERANALHNLIENNYANRNEGWQRLYELDIVRNLIIQKLDTEIATFEASQTAKELFN